MAYLLWLMPRGILDSPLTYTVGVSTVATLNLFAVHSRFTAVRAFQVLELDGGTESGNVTDIYYNGQNTLRIANACNGLEVMVLYAGFLFCYPGSTSRRFSFLAAGILLIFILNIIRCALLVWIYLHYRQYLDFSHHFAFTFVVYAFIFLLWFRYTRNAIPARPRPVRI